MDIRNFKSRKPYKVSNKKMKKKKEKYFSKNHKTSLHPRNNKKNFQHTIEETSKSGLPFKPVEKVTRPCKISDRSKKKKAFIPSLATVVRYTLAKLDDQFKQD